MKKLSYMIIIGIFCTFCLFYTNWQNKYEILKIYSPTKLGIDINRDKTISGDEIFTVTDIESFSTNPNDKNLKKYTKLFNITDEDYISLGYIAEEFAKQFNNKKVTLKIDKTNPEYANIKIDSVDYAKLLEYSGFGIKEDKICQKESFKKHLKNSRKLHLVLLNKKSNKYHKFNCKYAKLATDHILIPKRHLPKDAIPCNYCLNKNKNLNKIKTTHNIPNIKAPIQILDQGDIKLLYTDFTTHLKPSAECSSNICKELLNAIDNAKSNIDIAIYGYNEIPKITQALKNAKSRGVKIRFVYDSVLPPKQEIYLNNNIIKELSNENITDKTNDIMHNKFLIFDNELVYTGSANISSTGISEYSENNIIIIKSKEVAKIYTAEFEQMLNGNFHTDKNVRKKPDKIKIGESIIEIYFSPQDKTDKRVIELIENANKYIYIPAFLITHKNITNALIKSHKKGVEIKIILDASANTMAKSKYKELRKLGIPLKIENYAGKMHSKTMIIDDKYIILGSMNFSTSGASKNDENTIIIENDSFAKNYKNFFLYLWKRIPDEYLKKYPNAEGKESIGSCSDGVDNNYNGIVDGKEYSCK